MTTSILPLHVPLPPRPTRRAFFSLLLLVVTVLLLSYSRPSTLSSLPSFGLSSAPALTGPGYLSLIRASKTTKVPTVLLIGDRTQTFASGRPNDRTHLLSAEARMHYHKHATSSLPPEDETNSFLALDINSRGFSRKEQVPNIYLVPSDPGPHFTIKSESARPPTAWGYGINPVEEPREYDPSTLTPGGVVFGFTSTKSRVLQAFSRRGGYGWFPRAPATPKDQLSEIEILRHAQELRVDDSRPLDLAPEWKKAYKRPAHPKDKELLVILTGHNHTVFQHPSLEKVVLGQPLPSNVRVVGWEHESEAMRFFRLAKEMWAVDPEREWYIFMEEDTYFPDLTGLYATLSGYDSERDWVLGGITESEIDFASKGRIAYAGAGIAISKSLMLKLNSHNSWETCEIDFPTKTGDDLLSRCAALIMAQHNHEITTYDPAFHPTRMEGDASGFIQSGLRFASFHRTGNWLFPLSLGLSKEEENFRIKSAMDALGGGNFGRRFILESSSAEERMVRDKESGKEMRPEEIERRRKELEAGHWRKLEEEKAKAAAFEQAKIDAAKQKAEDDEFEKEWWEKRLRNLKATVSESEGAEREEKEKEMEWIENRLKQFADAKKSSDSKKEEVQPKVDHGKEEVKEKLNLDDQQGGKLPLLEAAVPEGDKKVVKEKEKEQTGHDLRKRAKKDNEDLLPPPPADWGLSETIAESTETLRRHKVVVVLGYSVTVYSGRGLSDEDFSKLETTWATEGIAYSLRRGLIEGIEKKTYYLRGVQDIGGDWWRLIHEGSDAEEERIEIIWRNGGDDV